MRIFKNNTELTDKIERLDISTYSLTMTTTDFLHVATDFPFNHLYLKIGETKNLISSTMKVEYYGTAWTEVVEVKDDTSALSTSGYVSFTPEKFNQWSYVINSNDTLGLTKVLYDKYWARISFSVNLTASIDLSFVGLKFNDDTDLFSEYPVFDDSNFMGAFKTGKTDWEEQEIKAAMIIVEDLEKKNIIVGPEQILDRKKFLGASVCKTAEIIFNAFGNDYIEQRKAAKEEYSKRLNLSQYNVDTNNDGVLDQKEIATKQGWLSR